jgi:hypothetical protein
MAASMKMAVLWDVAPCSLVETGWHFRDIDCLHQTDISEVLIVSIIRAMMEAVSTSETSVSFYDTTQHNTQEDRHILKLKLCKMRGICGTR